MNIGLLFQHDTHWFASFSLNKMLSALKIPIRSEIRDHSSCVNGPLRLFFEPVKPSVGNPFPSSNMASSLLRPHFSGILKPSMAAGLSRLRVAVSVRSGSFL